MSLHALANHMATTGRGPDSMLVHMSPDEIQSLQALAMANGGSLTINPQTGLPEAGFLDSLLPALVGFGLNTFLPGLGTAVGGMFGLGGAAGTAIAVGGATALASGDLSKGLMAGMGAYGGAGLGSSLASAGAPSAGMDAASAARDAGISAAAETSPAATAARLQAGANTAMSAPTDFMKSNMMNLGLAAAPAISGVYDDQPTSSAPKIHPGYIRVFDDSGKQVEAVKADEWGSRPVMKWGQVPPVKHYDAGGTTTDETKKGITKWGGVGELEPITTNPQDAGLSDSERAQRYLMGEGPNPFLFYHKPTAVDPVAKAAEATKEMATVIEQQQRGGNKSFDETGGIASFNKNASKTGLDIATDLGLKAANSGIPGLVNLGDMALSKIEAAKGNTPNLSSPFTLDPAQRKQAEQAIAEKVAADNATAAVAAQLQKDAENRAALQAEKQAAVERAVANKNYSNEGTKSTGNTSTGSGGTGGGLGTQPTGTNAALKSNEGYGARGGFLNNGRFDQRYADGGVTGGGSIDLHVPINLGGGQGGMGGGLGSLGGGFGGGNGIQQRGMSQPSPDFLGQQQQSLPGFQAMQKAQQDYNNSDEYKGFQQYAQQYQQKLGGQSSAFGGGMGGMRYGAFAEGGITALAQGGMYNLGSYSDGGRLLRGPGDGVSDDIPAIIGENQPARVADGEFVLPARFVSEVGNGSTEAGARKLYAMMDRVQKARAKTVGKNEIAVNTHAEKYLPA